nr:HAD family hydrolase [Gorillibacterium massiliense]
MPPERLFAPKPGGAGKPAPELFRRALTAMGVAPAQAVVVGDSRHNDITGALSVGMDAVWVRREHKNAPSLKKSGKGRILIVRSLDELEKLI